MELVKMIDGEPWQVLDILYNAMNDKDISKIKNILSDKNIPKEHKATGLELIYRISDRYDYAIPLFREYLTLEYIDRFLYLLFESNTPYYAKAKLYENIKLMVESSVYKNEMEYDGEYEFDNANSYYMELLKYPTLLDNFLEYLTVDLEWQIKQHNYLEFNNLIKRFVHSDILVHGDRIYDIYHFINKQNLDRDKRDLFVAILNKHHEKRYNRLAFDNNNMEDDIVSV